MARTPLLRALQTLAGEHRASEATGRPVEQVRDEAARARERRRDALSRRDVLVAAASVAAGVLVPHAAGWASPPAGASGLRVAIIGGGMAGLTAALTMVGRGLIPTIYEADERLGGRMRSDGPGCATCDPSRSSTETWEHGQVTDVFGELIDSDHRTMLSLARHYGLPLIDLLAAEPPDATETYYFNGSHYLKEDADRDFAATKRNLDADFRSAGYPTTYDRSRPGGRALDAMSVHHWIDSRVPGGHESQLGALLDVAYNIEFGAKTSDQSALNLVYLLGYQPAGRTALHVFGASDKRYRIAGGIERLPEAIAQDLVNRGVDIRLSHRLHLLSRRRSDGTYELQFDDGVKVRADMVVLALPFAALRHVDVSKAGFDALKTRAIRELGAGRNGKLHVQFYRRFWNEGAPWGVSGGTSYADTGYQASWEATRGQPGPTGILVNYTGGDVTDDIVEELGLTDPYWRVASTARPVEGMRAPVYDATERFLSELAPVFGDVGSLWNGRAALAVAHLSSLWSCSYAYWRVGQYQTIAGYERVRQGNVFFAGEHTSVDFQGRMEGAASEGARVGREVVAAARRA
jgi:monoamine oxidase